VYVYIALFTVSGSAWVVAYLSIIRAGRRDRTYGVPVVALAANLAFEAHWTLRTTFGWFGPLPGGATMPHAELTYRCMALWSLSWLLLNLVVLGQFLRFGHREFPQLGRTQFRSLAALVIGLGGAVLLLFQHDVGEGRGVPALTSVAIAFMDAALFLGFVNHRRSLRGQSLAAAVSRTVGDTSGCLAIVIGVWVFGYPEPHPHIAILWVLVGGTVALDLLYTAALLRLRHRAAPAGFGSGPSADGPDTELVVAERAA
jgi:hypothetical protein